MRTHILLLLIFFLFSFDWNIFSKDSIDYYKANRYYDKNQYDKAIELYKDILKNDPKNERAMYNLANSYYKSNKMKEAQKIYDQLFHNSKNKKIQSNSSYNSGNIFFNQKNYNSAIDQYIKSLKIDPNNKDAKLNLELSLKLAKQQKQKTSNSPQQQQKPSNSKDNKNQKNKQQKDQKKETAKQLLKTLSNKNRISNKKAKRYGGNSTSDETW